MGLDIHYQAMPENCTLLEHAQHHASLGNYLGFFPNYVKPGLADEIRLKIVQGRTSPNSNLEAAEFADEAYRTAQLYPGLEKRHLYYDDRGWDKLYYLLSEVRRANGWQYAHTDIIGRAIMGGDLLPFAEIGNSNEIRWLSPTEAQKVHLSFAQVTWEELEKHFDAPAMIRANVYKFPGGGSPWDFFVALRTFYAEVVAHGEGVISLMF